MAAPIAHEHIQKRAVLLIILHANLCCAYALSPTRARGRGPALVDVLIKGAANGERHLEIQGSEIEIQTAVDGFLTPRLEWRLSHCSESVRTKCVLVRVDDGVLPVFKELGPIQFSVKSRGQCKATLANSGQWVGAATQGDLSHGFVEWFQKLPTTHDQEKTAYLPLWSNTKKKANEWDYKLSEPFCNASASPDHVQKCFFLPMTNCQMGAKQWEQIRQDVPPFGKHMNVTIDTEARHMDEVKLQPEDLKVLWQMLFFRQNARTATEVGHREAAWRLQNPTWPNSGGEAACVAVHVRHGDKLEPFWQEAHHTIEKGYNRTFDEYLLEALHLLNERHPAAKSEYMKAKIFVMSDDKDIIKAAKEIDKATAFHVDPPTPLKSLETVLDASVTPGDTGNNFGSAYNGVTSDDMLAWLVSIRLMSECDAFVGNLDSGFANFIFHGICEQRNGKCPQAVTLGPTLSVSTAAFSVDISGPKVVKPAEFGKQ